MIERVSPVAKCIRIVGLQADDLTEIGDGRVILVQADAGERAAVKRLCIARIEPNCGIEISHGPLELAYGVACQSTRLVSFRHLRFQANELIEVANRESEGVSRIE